MHRQDLTVLVLAAGKGTRMKSSVSKVLVVLSGKPLLHYVLNLSSNLNPAQTIVVVGYQSDQVKAAFSDRDVKFVVQHEQLGTGHAAQQAEHILGGLKGQVLVLCGDMPLIRSQTLEKMVQLHKDKGAKCTILTLKSYGSFDFGRIIRDEKGLITKIVEFKDASEVEKNIDEFNSGVYCFENRLFFKALGQIDQDNSQKEYYLTDTIDYLVKNGYLVQAIQTKDADEILGINSPEDLDRAAKLLEEGHLN